MVRAWLAPFLHVALAQAQVRSLPLQTITTRHTWEISGEAAAMTPGLAHFFLSLFPFLRVTNVCFSLLLTHMRWR
jgi:hypothetical protein